jgi:hypothetical protein
MFGMNAYNKMKEEPPKRQKRLTMRLMLTASVIVAILATLGATYEFVCERIEAKEFRQQGRSVDIGGFRLNI